MKDDKANIKILNKKKNKRVKKLKMQRKIIIGGNWKCNNSLSASEKLVADVLNKVEFDSSKIEVVVSPVFLHIPVV